MPLVPLRIEVGRSKRSTATGFWRHLYSNHPFQIGQSARFSAQSAVERTRRGIQPLTDLHILYPAHRFCVRDLGPPSRSVRMRRRNASRGAIFPAHIKFSLTHRSLICSTQEAGSLASISLAHAAGDRSTLIANGSRPHTAASPSNAYRLPLTQAKKNSRSLFALLHPLRLRLTGVIPPAHPLAPYPPLNSIVSGA